MNKENRTWTQNELDFEKSRLKILIENEESTSEQSKKIVDRLKKQLELLNDALVVYKI
jgi:hypothetical protein